MCYVQYGCLEFFMMQQLIMSRQLWNKHLCYEGRPSPQQPWHYLPFRCVRSRTP